MNAVLESRITDYAFSFGLQKIETIQLEGFKKFFANLPVDPYMRGKYRQRRLSRLRISDHKLEKQQNGYLFQTKDYNPIQGNVKRKFAEIDDRLIALSAFQKLVFEFSDRCQLTPGGDIDVHQIRTTCSPNKFGNPAPEGIHRDGADFIGIFAVDRQNIAGGATHLYVEKKQKPVLNKVLNAGELLLLNDREFFHFTTPIKSLCDGAGTRDVFVLTSPSLQVDF